ncbi:exosortase A [Aestuariibacter sp. AA17]|uniref:Exosortase A n=1 Tax=Fluctibacter corallii TaxID=2984329 RepID=A0ABT3ABJ8_9ALTE|nr:exosortase A [Aestuariibacter sp. AA17]MCV2886045.1 exosortase A [Aestuariibacter sp. AA17]
MLNNHVFRMLLGTFLVWGALFYSSIASTVAIWNRSETFAHCFIILPICLYLIRQKWPLLKSAYIKPNYWLLLPVLGTLIVWTFGHLAGILVLEQLATFVMLPFMIWCVLGNQVARLMAFALAFWMFSVPVGEFLIPHLQELTADITVWSLQLTGIPVYREGLYIAIPGGLFEVAVACSGIRYLIASFTLGTLYAYITYQSKTKRVVFVIFSILLPLLANGIRAYGIVMIAHLSDMKYATGVDHLIYGWLFFGVVIFIMFSVGNIWAEPARVYKAEVTASRELRAPKLSLVTLGSLSLMAMATFSYARVMSDVVSDITYSPGQLVDTSIEVSNESWLPLFQNPSKTFLGRAQNFDVYIAYYDRNVQGQELINAENKLYNFTKWSIVNSHNEANYRVLELTNFAGDSRILAYTFVTEGITSPSSMKVKLYQAVQALFGIPQAGYALIVSREGERDENMTQALNTFFNSDLAQYLEE